jgi:N utilization substance protein A
VNELRGEKIDVVPWSENPGEFVANALQPAKVKEVRTDPDTGTALVIVPDYQLSLAIGKEGQNARLAARLTGWRIDIKSETQFAEDQRGAASASSAGTAGAAPASSAGGSGPDAVESPVDGQTQDGSDSAPPEPPAPEAGSAADVPADAGADVPAEDDTSAPAAVPDAGAEEPGVEASASSAAEAGS